MAVSATDPVPVPRGRRVSILGATGSIGCNTVDLISRAREKFEVEALTANSNVDLLAAQAKDLGAKMAVVANESRYKDLKDALSGTGIKVAAGEGAVSKTWAAHISLNMPGLGATEITVKLVGDKLSVDLIGSEQETLALFLRSQQSLTAGLESRGLKLDRLNVVHDQSLARHDSNAPALDVRA